MDTVELNNDTIHKLEWNCTGEEAIGGKKPLETVCRLPCPDGTLVPITNTTDTSTEITLDVICKPDGWIHANSPQGLSDDVTGKNLTEKPVVEFLELCKPTGIMSLGTP